MESAERYAVSPMRITSAEAPDNTPLVAPDEYRPHRVSAPAVVDDALNEATPMPAWRDYRASGSRQSHWFLIGRDGYPHLVETTSVDGRYQASGPGYRHQFDNAYDAFWTAEVLAKTFTDTSSTDLQPATDETMRANRP